jgi:hypothetical protein
MYVFTHEDEKLRQREAGMLYSRKAGATRSYLADYKRFSSIISVKSLVVQVTKAGAISGAQVMLEYNKFVDRIITAQNKAEKGEFTEDSQLNLDDFDWSGVLSSKFPFFVRMTIRGISTTIIKKLYELAAVVYLAPKLADRFTKDVVASFKRKVVRFGSRGVACMSIYSTYMYGLCMLNLSSLTYDMLLEGYAICEQKKVPDAKKSIIWVSKKSMYYATLTIASAAGGAAGSYLHPEYGSMLGATVTEMVAGAVATSVLLLD